MFPLMNGPSKTSPVAAPARLGVSLFCCAPVLAFVLALSPVAFAQEPPPQQAGTAQQPDGAAPPAPQATPSAAAQEPPPAPDAAQKPDTAQEEPAPAAAPATAPASGAAKAKNAKSEHSEEAGITEEELKQTLVGKPLYLRGGYLDNTLSFGEHGTLIGHSPQGSYTLSAIQIDKVHLTKHKVELDGARYGLHFLGALPYEDPTKALDRVKITPKKKVVKITIDRELVVTPKKKKEKESDKDKGKKGKPAVSVQAPAAAAAPAQPAAPAEPPELSEADQAKAEMAAAPPEERPADPGSVTTTTSAGHANKLLKEALDRIFATGLDDRMMAAMPDFWKLYYQAVAAKADYRPKDPNVLRQNTVDKKAVLVSRFEPESNEWAQANAVAGMALYHAVIGPDGKPEEIAVARPIDFGLDENAVEAIRKASFEPALKDGKPVPVLMDLVVQFRIYSKRTSVTAKPEAAGKPAEPSLPGPYSVQHQ